MVQKAIFDGLIGSVEVWELVSPEVPEAARQFVQQTFRIIETGNLRKVAAAFIFGREDLLPDVFQRIVDELNTQAGGKLDDFKYYLERHIGLDGDEHGPMATRLLQSLCGADDGLGEMAEQASVDCLLARQELWNGIYDAISREGVSLGNLDPAASAPQHTLSQGPR